MKIWSLVYSLQSSVINLFNLHFINNTCSYSLRHWANYIPICYISKIPKSWFNKQYLKNKKKEEKRERLNYMENFTTESRYLKLKVAFDRPDYQKLLMCPLIKRLGRQFVSKHAAEPLKRWAELLKHSAGFLRI